MALPIPPNGKAVGQFIAAIEDGPDAGAEPDIIPARGTVIFTATVTHVPVPGVPAPYTFLPRNRKGVFDADGFLCTPVTNASGDIQYGSDDMPLIQEQGVTLVANQIDGASVEGWAWQVSMRLTDEAGEWTQTIPPFNINVPAAGEIDLTKHVGVPAAPVVGLEQAWTLVDLAEQHAREARDAATLKHVSAKAAGDTLSPGDALKVSRWDSPADYLIPVPDGTGITPGSEFTLLSGGAGSGRLVSGEENLFPFPDARAGFSGGVWVARGTSNISVAPGAGPGGDDAIRVTASGATSSGALGHNGHSSGVWSLSDLGLRAGDLLSARAWLAPPEGQMARIQMRFYRGATFLSEPSATGTPGVGVRTLSGVVIPEGATHYSILSYSTGPAAGATFDIAQVRVTRGSSPAAAYFDGDYPSGVWWGTPYQSPSSLGRVYGNTSLTAGGRAILRYEGEGQWFSSLVGAGDDVLRRSDSLAVDRDNGQTGMFAPAVPFRTVDAPLVSGRSYLTRVVPSRDMLVQGIGFRVGTPSAANDPCSVGLFSAAGAQLATSGAVLGHLNGLGGTRVVPITATLLKAGVPYYVGLSATSTASLRRAEVFSDAFGLALPALESGQATAHPLPAVLPSLAAEDLAVLFVLREFM